MKECKTIKNGISAVAHVCSTGNALQILQTLSKRDEIPLCFAHKNTQDLVHTSFLSKSHSLPLVRQKPNHSPSFLGYSCSLTHSPYFTKKHFCTGCFKMSELPAKLAHQNTVPLQKVLRGSWWMHKYFARVLNLVQFIPIFNLKIPLPTARMPQNGYAWYSSLYFHSYKDWPTHENRGLVALVIIWAGELKKQLCEQSSLLAIYSCCSRPMEGWKKETRNTKPANPLRDLPDPPSPIRNIGILNRGTKISSSWAGLSYLIDITSRLEKLTFKSTSRVDFYKVSLQRTSSLRNQN